MALEIDEIHSFSQWLDIRDEWEHLLIRSEEDDLFLGTDWLQAWWKVYGEGRNLCIVTVRDVGELVGVAPLMTTNISKIARLSILELVGTGQSDRLGAFVKNGDASVQNAIWWHTSSIMDWDILDLRDLSEEGTTAKAVKDVFPTAGLEITTSPYIPIHDTFENYLSTLSGNFRHGIRRSWAKLNQGHPARVEVITKPEEIMRGFETLVDLSMRRWEGRGTSTLADEKMRAFLELALKSISGKGKVIFHSLTVSDEPMAMVLGFLHGNRYLYYLSGFDPRYSDLGPGRSLLMKVLEDCYDRGLKEMDLLRGGEDYKYRFNPLERRLLHCRYGRSIKARLFERMGH